MLHDSDASVVILAEAGIRSIDAGVEAAIPTFAEVTVEGRGAPPPPGFSEHC